MRSGPNKMSKVKFTTISSVITLDTERMGNLQSLFTHTNVPLTKVTKITSKKLGWYNAMEFIWKRYHKTFTRYNKRGKNWQH